MISFKKNKMIKPQKNKDEKNRLEELETFHILDTLPESAYDSLTSIAAKICEVPICLVSLLDKNRQWFKSHYGLNSSETQKDISFCGHAINEKNDFLIVEDARKDIRFHDNPLVIDNPNVIFYAGFVLKSKNNLPLGTFCIIDDKPRKLDKRQLKSLSIIRDLVMTLMEIRRYEYTLSKKGSDYEQLTMSIDKEIDEYLQTSLELIKIIETDYGSIIGNEGQKELKRISSSILKLTGNKV